MAEFGNHSDHVTFTNISGNRSMGGFVTLPEDGTITKLGAYFGKDSGAGDYVLAIYSLSGEVGTLVGYTAPVAIPGSYGWYEQDLITPAVVLAGSYYIAIWTTGTAAYTYYNVNAGTAMRGHDSPGIGTFPTPSASLTGLDTIAGVPSIYGVYTPAGGAALLKIVNE